MIRQLIAEKRKAKKKKKKKKKKLGAVKNGFFLVGIIRNLFKI